MRALVLALCLASCTQKASQSICVLMDTSGTYTDQTPEILQQVRLGLLPNLGGGDQLILMKIDSTSYGWSDVIATLDVPSGRGEAANQKRAFSAEMDKVKLKSSKYTDISGALLYCNEYMANIGKPVRKVLIYSDMKEELPPGMSRTFRKGEFAGTHIAVVNSKRLVGDQRDPESYRKRMDEWQKRLLQSGALSFQVFMGSSKVRAFMERK